MNEVHRWRYLGADGSALGESEKFASQEEAEAFMGARWAELYGAGVRTVVLERGGEAVYDMSLEAG